MGKVSIKHGDYVAISSTDNQAVINYYSSINKLIALSVAVTSSASTVDDIEEFFSLINLLAPKDAKTPYKLTPKKMVSLVEQRHQGCGISCIKVFKKASRQPVGLFLVSGSGTKIVLASFTGKAGNSEPVVEEIQYIQFASSSDADECIYLIKKMISRVRKASIK